MRHLTTGCSGRRFAPPLNRSVTVIGLRTALWRRDLDAELPLLADSGHRETVNLALPKTKLSTQSDTECQIEFELLHLKPQGLAAVASA